MTVLTDKDPQGTNNGAMGDIWLFGAMLLCSCVGYRSATRNGLSGVTGVGVSVVLCAILGTELWDQLLLWFATRTTTDLVAHLGVAVVALSAFFIIQKLKLYAIVKLLGLMLPVSFTSVRVPEYAVSTYKPPTTQQKVTMVSTGTIDGQRFLERNFDAGSEGFLEYLQKAFDEVTRAGREFQKLAQVSADTLLYRDDDGQLVRSSVVIREGTWVVAGEEVVDKTGQRWLKVSLRTRQGQKEGFIPLTKVRAAGQGSD